MPPALVPTPQPTHFDISKLTKAERRGFEDRRKDYLLARYGTEAQKRKFAALVRTTAPYAIFHNIAETAPAPPTVSSPPDVGVTETTSEQKAIGAVQPEEDDDLSESFNDQYAESDDGYSVSSEDDILPDANPVTTPASGTPTLRVQLVEQTLIVDDGMPNTDFSQDLNDGAGLLQATAVPMPPPSQNKHYVETAALGREEISYADLPSTTFVLWWAVLLAILVFVGYRFAQSKCWRRSKRSAIGLP